jgi:hypothetical protein
MALAYQAFMGDAFNQTIDMNTKTTASTDFGETTRNPRLLS